MRQLKLSIAALFLMSPFAANADFIEWNFEAELNATSTGDFVGIDGETVGLSMIFDDTDVWVSCCGGTLTFPAVSSTASISGPHTISLGGAVGAAGAIPGLAGIFRDIDLRSFGFVIDGLFHMGLQWSGPNSVDPVLGGNLLAEHLPTTLTGGIGIPATAAFSIYRFSNQVVSITPTNAVPEPSTLALLCVGLLGMGLSRRRSQQTGNIR